MAIRGEVFDVGVDLRRVSKTYGEILSEDSKKQLYISPGFAHGFLVLSDEAEFTYNCTEFYHGEDESDIYAMIPTLASTGHWMESVR